MRIVPAILSSVVVLAILFIIEHLFALRSDGNSSDVDSLVVKASDSTTCRHGMPTGEFLADQLESSEQPGLRKISNAEWIKECHAFWHDIDARVTRLLEVDAQDESGCLAGEYTQQGPGSASIEANGSLNGTHQD